MRRRGSAGRVDGRMRGSEVFPDGNTRSAPKIQSPLPQE